MCSACLSNHKDDWRWSCWLLIIGIPRQPQMDVFAPDELTNECVAWSRKLGSQFRVFNAKGGRRGALGARSWLLSLSNLTTLLFSHLQVPLSRFLVNYIYRELRSVMHTSAEQFILMQYGPSFSLATLVDLITSLAKQYLLHHEERRVGAIL